VRSLLSKSVIIRLLTLSTLILGIGILGNTALASVAPTISITTCNELLAIDDDVNNISQNYKLANDIDCSGIANFTPIGLGGGVWAGAGYGGVFDGQSYSISNLVIDESVYMVGLFAAADNAEIKNVTLSGGSVSGKGQVGALVGYARDSNLSNIHSNLNIVATEGNAGGLVGSVENFDEENSKIFERLSSTGNVTSNFGGTGGLLGSLYVEKGRSFTLRKSFATGNVSNPTGGFNYSTGGLIGYVDYGFGSDDLVVSVVIEDSYATGNVSGNSDVGGLIGAIDNNSQDFDSLFDLVLQRTYASGDVTGNDKVGGLVGIVASLDDDDYSMTIKDNFATGAVTSAGVSGAFIGSYNDNASIEITSQHNFFDNSNAVNVCNGHSALDGCTGIDEQAVPNYFKNNTTNSPLNTWNFFTIWKTQTNGYPVFVAFNYSDPDSDDVSDSIENGGPNGGDANDDGVQDSVQSQVTSLLSSVSSKYVTLETSACGYNNYVTISSVASNSVQDEAKFSYPAGLLNFTLTGCAVGGTETVTQYYYGDYDLSKVVVRKYNSATNEYATIESAVITSVIIGGQAATKVTYQVTDGGPLDQDGVANGTIVDPAGLAVLGVTSPNTGFEQKNQIEAILMIGSALALVIAARFYGKRQVSKK
jgi:hypothetical protein